MTSFGQVYGLTSRSDLSPFFPGWIAWEPRDANALVERVDEMNPVIARFAGALTDAVRRAGGDSRQLRGAIVAHPEFERLETRGHTREPGA